MQDGDFALLQLLHLGSNCGKEFDDNDKDKDKGKQDDNPQMSSRDFGSPKFHASAQETTMT